MKVIGITLLALSFGAVAGLAQTGAPASPTVSNGAAPVQAATPQPKPPRRPQRDAQAASRKPVVESATPRPSPNHQPSQTLPARAPAPAVAPVPKVSYADALKRQHHQRHDRQWWTTRYTTIVFVTNAGYYYWDAGYWFPALGYDSQYENFDYNGPIYTYGNLLPDQVVYNVQRALKDLGYYAGPLTGSYSAATRAAIAAFQQDNELDATGGIDAPTVEALGLN